MTEQHHYEVAYALPEKQIILNVSSEEELTVEQAIDLSGVVEMFPELQGQTLKAGIFGKLAKMDAKLFEGDRVEIYRPLIADPKEARKKRAAEGKSMKKGARA